MTGIGLRLMAANLSLRLRPRLKPRSIMNTRRYPRTLHEAFPFGPTYGAAVERPMPVSRKPGVIAALLCVVLLLIVVGVQQ